MDRSFVMIVDLIGADEERWLFGVFGRFFEVRSREFGGAETVGIARLRFMILVSGAGIGGREPRGGRDPFSLSEESLTQTSAEGTAPNFICRGNLTPAESSIDSVRNGRFL